MRNQNEAIIVIILMIKYEIRIIIRQNTHTIPYVFILIFKLLFKHICIFIL